MGRRTQPMGRRKRIALVAHDNKKRDLLDWVRLHRERLAEHALCATGTTGGLLAREAGLPIQRLQSGPLGGDLQIGARIASGDVDVLVFFWDPLEALPHDPDVRALLRVCAVWNIPVALNPASADFIFSSPFMHETYDREVPDYEHPAIRPRAGHGFPPPPTSAGEVLPVDPEA